MTPRLRRLVSGGQTGADRAALDVALELGLEIGGWVPRGRVAEDGVIPARYTGLHETESADPAVRTSCNVRDADATLIMSHGPLAGGSRFTADEAAQLSKPLLHLDLATLALADAAEQLRGWLRATDPEVLNVAGPRASEDPRIGAVVTTLLRAVLP
jgi:hypothetical protein